MEQGIDKGTVWLNGLLAILQGQGHQPASFARLLGITRQAMNQRIQAGKQTLIYSRWKKGNTNVGDEENV